MSKRAVDWISRWADLDADTKQRVTAVAQDLATSELIQDRTYHLKSYSKCFVRIASFLGFAIAQLSFGLLCMFCRDSYPCSSNRCCVPCHTQVAEEAVK